MYLYATPVAQFADIIDSGYPHVDVLLPPDDTEPQLLQPTQRQSSVPVRPSFRVGREHLERFGQFKVYRHR